MSYERELDQIADVIKGLHKKLNADNYEKFFDVLAAKAPLDKELMEAIDQSCNPELSRDEIKRIIRDAVDSAYRKHGTEQLAALDAALSLIEKAKRKTFEGKIMTRFGILINEAAGGVTLKYQMFDNGQGDKRDQAKDLVDRLMKEYFPSRINGAVVMGDGSIIGVVPAAVGTAMVDVDVFDLAKSLGYQIKSAGSCGALVTPIGSADQATVLNGNQSITPAAVGTAQDGDDLNAN